MVYDPLEFSLTMNMLMNGNNIYSNSMSGKNPPPMCMPIPVPYIPIQMEMCMVLFNIMQPGNNMHACMDLEFKMQNIKMMVVFFTLFRKNKSFSFKTYFRFFTSTVSAWVKTMHGSNPKITEAWTKTGR